MIVIALVITVLVIVGHDELIAGAHVEDPDRARLMAVSRMDDLVIDDQPDVFVDHERLVVRSRA